ncbi:MAG: Asp23/Gls24 family envelope stress response protein [Clostridiales Family XIII bacterium]|nr:Asp23/Gls24 family envelope stress response protein [Clostridiales Family XIII bacterium]
MQITETTGLGTIRYSKQIIGDIIRHIVERMDGRAILADTKGRMRKGAAKPNSDDVSFIEVKRDRDAMDITLYIVVKFGAGIQRVATEISDSARAEILRMTGIHVDCVRVVVTGVVSRNFKKRHIEVVSHAD